MADIENAAWSETAASNISPSPDGWPSNSSPLIVYSTDREMMGAIKRDWNRRNAAVTSGGSANAQTLTYTSNPTALVRGQRYAFIAGFANTGATTLTVGGLAATAVQANGAALVGGELKVGLISEVIYDGTNFQLIAGSGAASGASLAGLTIAGANPNLVLNKAASGGIDGIAGLTNGSNRWFMALGNNVAEAPTATGSDFTLTRYDNTGTLIDTPITVTRASGAVAIKGDITGSNAAAGFIGEYLSSVVLSPGTTLTTGTPANATSLALTAGDWDVSGELWVSVGTGGATLMIAAITTSSASTPGSPGVGLSMVRITTAFTASSVETLAISPARISVSSTTNVYLTAYVAFPSGTTTAYGRIGARRMR